MSTEEPKPASSPNDDAKAEPGGAAISPGPDVDAAVAWPPPEAAPAGEAAAASPEPKPASEGAGSANDSGVMTAPDPAPAAKPAADASGAEMPAATPQEEMGLSNSTLHWLEDGEQAVPGRLTEPGSMPSYDPRAPVAGRTRAVLVVVGSGLLALVIAGYFYGQAQKRRAAEAPAVVAVEPARDLTNRAEAALAADKVDEALDLAHLALVADPRFADAHFVVAACKKSRGDAATARDEFRKYLELAPLGTHAADARAALASLPP
jgi:tetratricopeptide (TPR) repeat protein